jgi:hypothetical protein
MTNERVLLVWHKKKKFKIQKKKKKQRIISNLKKMNPANIRNIF